MPLDACMTSSGNGRAKHCLMSTRCTPWLSRGRDLRKSSATMSLRRKFTIKCRLRQVTNEPRPHFMDAHPLLVLFHDPPAVMNMADSVTGKTELHNTWLVSPYSLVLHIRWLLHGDWCYQEIYWLGHLGRVSSNRREHPEGDWYRRCKVQLTGSIQMLLTVSRTMLAS